ncbi:hormogonium polysaccharide biosynthesis glycosyltransferase HpsE [Leptolyngbya sp. PCC 6406]|uniref:hormogonium polysaccharide biosynthesis glycosyltransferase HpsE n=1 Tax=Leptolyngbya sp. PCC 6406 TaxID=1173264 RepID=UPI0002AC3D69|nr:hormogonium polysaccharide biosynthesis glycosyltransferase HpsE [Leptolyngbya sp. PCC 6406]
MPETEGIPSPLDITVAIPTYNGAQRLPQVLERLQAQVNTEGLRWEVLVIDNNSQDNTAEVVRQLQTQWPSAFPLRYIFEPRQGAAFARQAAMQAITSELVGFLDDDNLPEVNWVAEAVDFSRRHPKAGAFSGRIEGCYETTPPEGFEQVKAFLAIRDHGSKVIAFEPDKLQLPPAASLLIRRQAWVDCVPAQPALTGKLPGLFIQGDDYEPLLYIHKGNWQILYNPALKTYHQISRQRFEKEYLMTLARGCGLATCQLALITANSWHKPLIVLRIFLGNLRRLSVHILKHKGHINIDLPTAFKFEFYLGSLLSPLYIRRW